MMIKIKNFLVLLAFSYGVNCVPLEDKQTTIVSTKPSVSTSTITPVVDGQAENNNISYVPCTSDEQGKTISGQCVPYYLCNPKPYSAEEYGLIDIHLPVDSPCENVLDICCEKQDILEKGEVLERNQKVSEKPKQKDQKGQGCGWANPGGLGLAAAGPVGATKFGEFPWMVAVLQIEPVDEKIINGETFKIYIGGGSLIHPSVVLTGAHVPKADKPLMVRAGEWDTQTNHELYPHQDRHVASIEVHKDFNKGNLIYDIALLFLAKPVELAPNVGVVCLPPPRSKVANTRCVATGWGKDKFGKEGRYSVILKKVVVPVVEHDVCQAALRQTRLGKLFMLHSTFMCAGGEQDIDTCTRDGGSPLSCPIENEKDRYIQSGIVAWGIGCGADGTPGVYVDVANLRDWIDDKMAGKGYEINVYTY